MKKLLPLFLLLQFVAIRSFSQDITGPVSKATEVAQNNSSIVNSSYSTKSISRFSQQASTSATPVYQSNLILGNVSSVKSGLWSQAATWSTGTVPTASDNVTISDGTTITIDVAANAYSLIVGQGSSGKLFYNNGMSNTLTISKDVNIKAGAILSTPGSGAAINTNILSMGGSLLNQGTLDLIPSGGTQSGALSFTGEGNVNYTGTGINNLALLNAAKTNPADIIEINVNNFTTGGLSTGATTGLLTSEYGTGIIKFSGTNAYDGVLFSSGNYTIPSTLGIWLNNPNFKINGQNGVCFLEGLLHITKGIFNIGKGYNNYMGFDDNSQIIIEGGQVNTTGLFGVAYNDAIINYAQSGGVITVSTAGNTLMDAGSFDLGTNKSSSISITGGEIIVQLAATGEDRIDYRNQAGANGSADVTGGTLQLGNSLSGTSKNFNIRGVVPNLALTNTSANHTAIWGYPINYNNIALDITLDEGTTMDFGNRMFLWAGTTFTNNGTLVHNGSESRFITYNSATPQTYTGKGTAGTNEAPMKSFELQSIKGFTFAQSGPNLIATRFNEFIGMLHGTNKLTIGTGSATSAAVIQVGNTTTPDNALGYDAPLNINEGAAGTILLFLRTTSAWTIQKEIPPSQNLRKLTIDNNDPSHITTLGTAGNLTITNNIAEVSLILKNGNLNLNGKNIRLGDATQPGLLSYGYTNNYMYNGSYTRWIPAIASAYLTPMGNATNSKLSIIRYTTAPSTAGTLTANWSDTDPGFPNNSPLMEGSLVINRTSNQGSWFYKANDGLAGGTYTGEFLADGSTDVLDYTKTVLLKRPSAGGNWTLNGTHVTTTGSNTAPELSRTEMSGFSEFAIGGENNVALPISLEYFRGNNRGMANILDWKIGCTGDIKIALQRSAESIDGYEEINTQNATALRCLESFQYADNNPLQGFNYYRLKLTTIDGELRYSNIVLIKNKTVGFELLSVNPNPVKSTAVLNANFQKSGKISLKITDNYGRAINSSHANVTAGINNISLQVGNLASGTYYVTTATESGESQTIKFVKY